MCKNMLCVGMNFTYDLDKNLISPILWLVSFVSIYLTKMSKGHLQFLSLSCLPLHGICYLADLGRGPICDKWEIIPSSSVSIYISKGSS